MNHTRRVRVTILRPRRRIGASFTRKWKCKDKVISQPQIDAESSYIGHTPISKRKEKVSVIFA